MKRITIEVSDDLHTKVKLTAVKEGITMKELFLKAIENYLGRKLNENEKK